MADSKLAIEHDAAAQRYEVTVEGLRSLVQYDQQGNRINYLHTEVPDAIRRRGIASALARAALDDARAAQLTVIPRCPFISSYIARHPEYLSLVDPAYPMRPA